MGIVNKEVVVDVEIEFDVNCNVCGKDLETTTNKYNVLCVEPCETCLTKEYEKGMAEGK